MSQPIDNLIKIMQQLRTPTTGCPWDLKQTYQSIVPHTIEEAYEVADAIEQGDMVELKKELGDLLFQVVFYAQLATEDQHFDFNDVVEAVCEKLTRRHPHVFGEENFEDEKTIKQNWENEKTKEREIKAGKEISVLADIPKKVLDDIEITAVKTVDEVIKIALTKELKTVEWIDVDPISSQKIKETPTVRSTN